MSYLKEVIAEFMNATVDSFARLRVSQPYTLLDLKQIYDSQPLFYDDQQTSGSGTSSTYLTNNAATRLSVSGATAGTRVKQSKTRGIYQPGKGMLVLLTGVFDGSGTGITKRIGYFDALNGLFFQHKDGVLSVVRRTYVTGVAVDTVIPQSSWNVDKMDGTGSSGITIDTSKTQIFSIDFEWLGVGRVRFGVNIDGQFYYVHELLNANNLTEVYIGNPNLPIRYEIINDGTGVASHVDTICASIVSEGGQEDIALSTHVSRLGLPITLAAQDLFTPVISVRLKSDRLSTKINPLVSDLILTTTTNYAWKITVNPVIAGTDAASWTGVTNSSLEYDITRDNTNTVTGGYDIAGGYGSSTNQAKFSATGVVRSFLSIGSNIDGSRDELVLSVANIDGNGGTAYGSMTLGEYN